MGLRLIKYVTIALNIYNTFQEYSTPYIAILQNTVASADKLGLNYNKASTKTIYDLLRARSKRTCDIHDRSCTVADEYY